MVCDVLGTYDTIIWRFIPRIETALKKLPKTAFSVRIVINVWLCAVPRHGTTRSRAYEKSQTAYSFAFAMRHRYNS